MLMLVFKLCVFLFEWLVFEFDLFGLEEDLVKFVRMGLL